MKRHDLERRDPAKPPHDEVHGEQRSPLSAATLIRRVLACGSLAVTIAVVGAAFLAARMDTAPPGALHAATAMSIVFMAVFLLTLKILGVTFESLMRLLWRQPLIAGVVIIYGVFIAASSAEGVAQSMKTSFELKAEANKLDDEAAQMKQVASLPADAASAAQSAPNHTFESAETNSASNIASQEPTQAVHDIEASGDPDHDLRVRRSIRDRESRDRETRDR